MLTMFSIIPWRVIVYVELSTVHSCRPELMCVRLCALQNSIEKPGCIRRLSRHYIGVIVHAAEQAGTRPRRLRSRGRAAVGS